METPTSHTQMYTFHPLTSMMNFDSVPFISPKSWTLTEVSTMTSSLVLKESRTRNNFGHALKFQVIDHWNPFQIEETSGTGTRTFSSFVSRLKGRRQSLTRPSYHSLVTAIKELTGEIVQVSDLTRLKDLTPITALDSIGPSGVKGPNKQIKRLITGQLPRKRAVSAASCA